VTQHRPQDAGSSPSGRPTLKTIAKLCGLGVPTVSRAMNDSPEIGEETKRRIRQIAEEIGYVPDRAGLRLRTGRTQIISLAFVIHRDDQMGQLITSIATGLQSTPFQIGIAPVLSNDDGLKSIRQVVEDRMADAVIFNETLIDDPRVKYLLDRKFPFATHGRNALSEGHPYFDFDNEAFARRAAEVLHKRGRQFLALFGPPHLHNYGRDTFQGASQAAAKLGLSFIEIEGARSNEPLVDLQAVARRFVADHPDCDGYVCSSGAATLAIASALDEAGRVIGRDVDVIAKGSRTFLGMVRPGIVAVEEDVGRAADFLTRAVLQALRAPDLPPMQEVEQPDFSAFY
jgi:LacI family transcriptional regulator